MAETNKTQNRETLTRHDSGQKGLQRQLEIATNFKDVVVRAVAPIDVAMPFVGMVVQDPVSYQLWWYGLDEIWHSVAGTATYEIKVTADDGGTSTTDKFIFAVPLELNLWTLASAEAFVTTVGSGATIVDVRNDTTALDMLTSHIRIDSGETTSYTSSVPTVIAGTPNKVIHTADLVHIIVDSAGVGAQGLGVILKFTVPVI